MQFSTQNTTLSADQVRELAEKLSTMRHDINNYLSLVMAAVELIRHKPQMSERMLNTLAEQPPKIIESISGFSAAFERTLSVTRS